MIHPTGVPPRGRLPGSALPDVPGRRTCPERFAVAADEGAEDEPPRPPAPPVELPPAPAVYTYDGSTAVCWPPSPPGVRSDRRPPAPLKYISGQAWASA